MPNLVIRPVQLPSDLVGVENGNLDPDLLVGVGKRGQLHHLCARAWFALCAEATTAGFNLTYTYGGTYRTYADQAWLFRSRYMVGGQHGGCKVWDGALWCKKLVNGKVPASAAVPGTSNHGLGLAIDTALDNDPGDGVSPDDAENITPALEWLSIHAPRFGFSWEGPVTAIEPWHLRYVTGDAVPQAVLDWETPVVVPDPDEEDDMPKPLFIGTPEGAQYLWVAGCKPQGFENPTERDKILAAYGIDPNTGVTMSQGQVDRLFWNA